MEVRNSFRQELNSSKRAEESSAALARRDMSLEEEAESSSPERFTLISLHL